MIPLVKLKREVQFNTEFTQSVDIMKGIAMSRFFTLQRKLAQFEPFDKAVEELLSVVDWDLVAHPFVQSRSDRVGVVMVTSDAGFLGGLNTQVINVGLHEGGTQSALTVIGERGGGYLSDLHHDCESFPGIEDSTRLSLALAVRDRVVQQVVQGECGRLVVVYPKPVSFTVQQVTVETLVPYRPASAERQSRPADPDLLWESSQEELVGYVVAQWIGHRLYELFALSRLAEMAARAMHLEGSFQELLRRGKRLQHDYLRARHEALDRSIREIFAAQLLSKRREEEAEAEHDEASKS